MTEDGLLAVVVQQRMKDEAAAVLRVVREAARVEDRPAGEATRDLLHVLLRVSAVYSERVQLHQLARVVLVDAAPHPLRLARDGLSRLLLLLTQAALPA